MDRPGLQFENEETSFPSGPVHGRYAKVLASSATAAICAGEDNLIVSWNTAAEELFGYSAQEAIGQPLSIIVPPRHRAAHAAGLARATQSGHARLAGRLVEVLSLHADGSERPVDLCLSMWSEDGRPMFGALVRDITDRRAAQRRLEHLANCDTLTSLPNRNALHERLAVEITKGPCCLLLMDLDGFKFVNDTIGHSVGDQIIAAVASRLTSAAAEIGYTARLGGDEFAIILPGCADPLAIDIVTKRVFAALEPPFEIAGQHLYVGTSIGIAMAPKDAEDVEHLLRRADLALYRSKGEGGGIRTYFTRSMQVDAEQRHRVGSELRTALRNNEFELFYQPQVSLLDNKLSGLEALLRWHHPEHGLLSPPTFLSELEDSPIAEEVGDWIVRTACETAANLKRAGLGPLRIGINLFPAQLRSGRLYAVVSAALKSSGIAPHQLELEITENTVLRYNTQSTSALRKLRDMGVGVAFDDFGTGFASLSLLQKYPLTRLKIDQSFIVRINNAASDAAIVEAVIAMAKGLDLQVIAEGVETAEQETTLRRLGCHEAQGYRYGRAVTEAAIVEYYAMGLTANQLIRG